MSASTKTPLLPDKKEKTCLNNFLKWTEFFSYGFGHFFNDLCASLWFTYLLLFYHSVIQLDNRLAGLLILIGQVADAISTPLVGLASDWTRVKFYGRRKLWHLIGTFCVMVSFSFIWRDCLICRIDALKDNLAAEVIYYSIFIIIFQFGWATVQISHLSLIPEITSDESERVGLTSIRNVFTILANITVFLSLLILFGTSTGVDSKVSPNDINSYWYLSLGTIGVGAFFSFLFQIGVRESTNYNSSLSVSVSTNMVDKTTVPCKLKVKKWYMWFAQPKFYITAILYMSTRLVVNVSQVYISLYLIDTLKLGKLSVTLAPLVIYISGLFTTFVTKLVNKWLGRYMTYIIGIALIWGALETFWVVHSGNDAQISYLGAALLGAGGSTILVTSLSMTSDLIGDNTNTGAFVFGAMSFTDKLANGLVIQMIQLGHPCHGSGTTNCCAGCIWYYRDIIVYVPGGASMIAFTLACLLGLLAYVKNYREMKSYSIQDD